MLGSVPSYSRYMSDNWPAQSLDTTGTLLQLDGTELQPQAGVV